ncbi:Essential protein Yae1 N-terminal domain-containing protein [[Candida] zeylanoides]
MSSVNLDSLLDLEEEYYSQGLREGQARSTHTQYLEGKEYGYQTGYQRFLVVGYMRALAAEWSERPNSGSLATHLAQLRQMVADIPTSNDDAAVAQYEKAVTKARNKMRVVATLAGEGSRVQRLDELVREVGGELQVSENQDEMW